MSTINDIIEELPEYAKDIKLNLEDIFLNEEENGLLTKYQLYGVALTAAYFLAHEMLFDSLRHEAKIYFEHDGSGAELEYQACKSAAVSIKMTSVYHNFTSQTLISELRNFPSDLQIPELQNPNINQVNFYMYCFVSAVLSGCEYCSDVFANKLLKLNINHKTLAYIVKVAAVLKALKTVLKIEDMRVCDLSVRGPGL